MGILDLLSSRNPEAEHALGKPMDDAAAARRTESEHARTQAREAAETKDSANDPEKIITNVRLRETQRADDPEWQAEKRAEAEAFVLLQPSKPSEADPRITKARELKEKYTREYTADPAAMRKFRDMSITERAKYLAELSQTKDAQAGNVSIRTPGMAAIMLPLANAKLNGFVADAERGALIMTDEFRNTRRAFQSELKQYLPKSAPAASVSASATPAPTPQPSQTPQAAPTHPTDAAIAALPDVVKGNALLFTLAKLFIVFSQSNDTSTFSEKLARVFAVTPAKPKDKAPSPPEGTPPTDYSATVVAFLKTSGIAEDTTYHQTTTTPADAATFDRAKIYLRDLHTKEGLPPALTGTYAYRRGDEAIIAQVIDPNAESIANHRTLARLATEYVGTDAGKSQPDPRGFVEWLRTRQAVA